MRIGLYGLPTVGKTFILSAVRNLEVLSGSSLLKEIAPDFENLQEAEKVKVREKLAFELKKKDKFIMDGHYSFGENVVFTEADGQLYDAFLYVYVDPVIITQRMSDSIRNNKYLKYDIEKWQNFEIESLRSYCHDNDKDFYVIDNPEEGFFTNINMILEFIDSIVAGYSPVRFAHEVVLKIDKADEVSLIDGDRTYIQEDSSRILGYKTHLFDGNFYTGFQAWRHNREMNEYLKLTDYYEQTIENIDFTRNEKVSEKIKGTAVILTSGHYGIWKKIAEADKVSFFYGAQMCSDTKYFITKYLQEKGCKVLAFGDSMNDYYMLKKADNGYLVLKNDGSVSSSLEGKNLEGLIFV